jgi:ribosome maturation factor RimP
MPRRGAGRTDREEGPVGAESSRTRPYRGRGGTSSRERSVPRGAPSSEAAERRSSRGDRNVAADGGRGAGRQRVPSRDALRGLLEPLVSGAGYDLEELAVTSVGKRRLVRLVVDADDGVDLDDVAALSERVSATLDASDVMGPRPYVLEVTSPGVDRPLTEPRHWRRAVGRLVRASLTAGGDVAGRVVAADDEVVLFDVTGDERRFRYAELGRGRVQVEFRRDDGEG